MPATAGRVRMPANNRVHSSAALQTHGIWQSAIGYDPYAPTAAAVNTAAASKPSDRPSDSSHADAERGSGENAYASFQGLLALAKITTGVGAAADDVRGACKKCHRVGHLSFQCRNFLSTKDNDDPTALEAAATAFNKIKKKDLESEDDDDVEDDESDSTDSDVDPDIERILASRLGKKSAKGKHGVDRGEGDRRGRSKSRKSKRSRNSSSSSDDEDEEEEDKKRREKRRHRHRSEGSDDDDDEDRRRHKHHRSRKEKKRRRSHRRSSEDDDESGEEAKRHRHHKQRNRGSGSDEDRERSGRKKRRSESEKRSRSSKHKH